MATLRENFYKNRGLGVNPLVEGLEDFYVEPQENDDGKSQAQKELMTKIPGVTPPSFGQIAIGKLGAETIIAGHNEDVYKGNHVSYELLGILKTESGNDFFFRASQQPGFSSSKTNREIKRAKLLKIVEPDNAY